LGIIGEEKKEFPERIIGRFKSIFFGSLLKTPQSEKTELSTSFIAYIAKSSGSSYISPNLF